MPKKGKKPASAKNTAGRSTAKVRGAQKKVSPMGRVKREKRVDRVSRKTTSKPVKSRKKKVVRRR